MTQRSKKHHYLPRFILSGFAQNGQVRTVDLASGRSFLQSVFDAAAENDYNTLDLGDGTKSDVAEKAIAEHVETPAAMVLQRITAGGWLDSPDERLVLAKFLALQFQALLCLLRPPAP